MEAIEYDPNRSVNLALIKFEDGVKAYILCPNGLRPGAKVVSGPDSPPDAKSSRLLIPQQFALLKTLPVRDLQPLGDSGVKRVADQMLAALEAPLSVNRSGLA